MVLDPVLIIGAAAAVLVVGSLGGFLIGRRSGSPRERIRELEGQLESANKERELAQASVEAAKAEIAGLETRLEDYRGEVVDHFTGTSGLLRDLTLQYRAVYDHLTHGATTLCPEGSVGLPEGPLPEKLPEGTPDEPEPPQAAPEA
jgi:uncharacterized membrane-anchored protein YhcB (DUF1043 family)